MNSTTQDIFNRILSGEQVQVLFVSHSEYHSLRCGLLKKFRKYNQTLESIGADGLKDHKFLKASWNSTEVSGTFSLEDVAARTNNGQRKYTIKTL